MTTLTPEQIKTKVTAIFEVLTKSAEDASTNAGRERIEDMEVHQRGYAEPGYDGDVILVGNFNSINKYDSEARQFVDLDDMPERVSKAAEELNVEIEWSDEWAACQECERLVRTEADSYGWRRSYGEIDDGVTCAECICEDPVDYLESIEGNPRMAVTFPIDLAEHGYVKIGDDDGYKNGLYGGQSDDPTVISASLNERGITRILFEIDAVGQFDLDFKVWVHRNDVEEFGPVTSVESEGEDPAEAMKRGLASIPPMTKGRPSEDGIHHHTINRDGTVDSRTITPEEFVDGSWAKDN